MNALKSLFIALTVSLVFAACEKVVNLEVPGSDPVLVVEGQISNLKDTWKIRLSRSQDYFERDGQFFVDDATVAIADGNGNTTVLSYQGEGVYESSDSMQAAVGMTYQLRIEWNGENYVASERCRPQLPVDTFAVYFLPDNNGFIPSGWYAFIGAEEQPGAGDHYQWLVFKNDTLEEGFGGGYILDNDDLVEFGYFNTGIDPADPLAGGRLPRPIGGPYDPGDTIRIEQLAISKGYFDYLNDVSTQRSPGGSPFDAPAANPAGNVSNNALGYFSVVNAQFRELVVVE